MGLDPKLSEGRLKILLCVHFEVQSVQALVSVIVIDQGRDFNHLCIPFSDYGLGTRGYSAQLGDHNRNCSPNDGDRAEEAS